MTVFNFEGRACGIPNQLDRGKCLWRSDCPQYLRLLQSGNLTSASISFLRKIHCSVQADDEDTIICCPTNNREYM